MLTRHVLICCKYLLSRYFLSNAVIFSCGDVGISALFTLYWVKMELILLAKLSCPCSASVKSSSYIRFIIHSLGILKMRNQYLISWSCCLRCNGNCPVSTYTARSGVLWRTRSALKILKESCVGNALPTALNTDVLDAIMAFVVLSF